MTPNVASIVLLAFAATGTPIGLSWSPPTENIDGSLIVEPLTYNVYRSNNGAPYRLTPHANIAATKVDITGFVSGETLCFEVTAIEGGVESSASLSACITVP